MRVIAATLLILFSLFAFASEVPVNGNLVTSVETRTVNLIDSDNVIEKVPGTPTEPFRIIVGILLGAGLGIGAGALLAALIGPFAVLAGLFAGAGLGGILATKDEFVEKSYTVSYVRDVNTKEEFKVRTGGPKQMVLESTPLTMIRYSDGTYSLRRQ